jgi:hypothetical protein
VTDQDRGLRRELLWAYGPCGHEDAMRDVCHRVLVEFLRVP